MKRRHCLVALFWLLLAAAPAVASPPTPMAQVRTNVEKVLTLLRDPQLKGDARSQQLSAALRPMFDFRLMSQWVLALHWRQATPAQQDRFVTLFTDLLETTYLGRIEAYSGEKVEFLKQQVEGKMAQVNTQILYQNKEIPIDYRLYHEGEQWRVFDVVIENVSLVRNFRSTYGEIIDSDGMEGLLKRMEKKLQELKTPGGKGGA